jgi:predicted permease
MRPVIRTRFGRRSLPGEVNDELAFHIDMRARQLIDSGLPPDEAMAEARRRFGDLGEVRDNCVTYDEERLRSMNRMNFAHDLRQDLGYAARMLRRAPVVSLVVILTLALGIGANTAIFSLVNAVLLKKLDVKAPDELVVLGDPVRVGSMGFDTNPRTDLYSYETYLALLKDPKLGTLVSGLAATGRVDRMDFRADGKTRESQQPRSRMVSGNYFEVLGIPAVLGRAFKRGEEDVIGGSPVIVISHGFWQRRFAGDSSVIGREVLINDARFTIIGITPSSFRGEIVGQSFDLWIPASMQAVIYPNRQILDQTGAYWLLLMARRAPGVSLEQEKSGFTDAVRRILVQQQNVPALVQRAETTTVRVSSGARGLSRVRNTYRAPLLILTGGVGLLLLIICANVANILLARAVARTREMSVRLAIGAGRGRLVRQLLTESLVLGLLGAAAGLLVSNWMSRVLLVMAADGGNVLPLDTGIGLPALVFTTLLSLTAVVAFGLMPAIRASRVEVADAMRASGKALTGSGGGMSHRNPLGRLLIASQVALSVVLIAGATLLVRSVQHLQGVDTGLDRDKLIIVDVDANSRGYDGARLTALAMDLRTRLEAVPGVAGVSFNENGIFTGTESMANFGIAGFENRQQSDSVSYYDQIGPGFVKAAGARLIYGRDFSETDVVGTSRAVVLNQSFAQYYFGKENPVGRSMRLGDGDSVSAEVVGVIADVKDQTLVGPSRRRFYVSYLQHPLGDAGSLRLIVRASGDPVSLMPAVRKAITETDALLPIEDLDPLSRLMRQSIGEERLLAKLAMIFGSSALLLAAIGLYGVMSYAVSRRAGEIGLRVALGARRVEVVRMVLRDALLLVGIGVMVGIPLTLAASRIIRNQLHGVEPNDPIAFGVALGVLGLGAVLAAAVPALRASRVAPVVALRAE